MTPKNLQHPPSTDQKVHHVIHSKIRTSLDPQVGGREITPENARGDGGVAREGSGRSLPWVSVCPPCLLLARARFWTWRGPGMPEARRTEVVDVFSSIVCQ